MGIDDTDKYDKCMEKAVNSKDGEVDQDKLAAFEACKEEVAAAMPEKEEMDGDMDGDDEGKGNGKPGKGNGKPGKGGKGDKDDEDEDMSAENVDGEDEDMAATQ